MKSKQTTAISSPSTWSTASDEPNGKRHEFEVPEFRRYCLLNGLDDIGITLQHADEIKAFEQQRLNQKPWLAKTIY